MEDLPVLYEELSWANKKLVREEYIKLQEGRCYHCGNLLAGIPSEEAMHHIVVGLCQLVLGNIDGY
jgi:hypothetical protein